VSHAASAEGRSLASTYERLLWRKQTPGTRISEAGNDPNATLRTDFSGAASCLNLAEKIDAVFSLNTSLIAAILPPMLVSGFICPPLHVYLNMLSAKLAGN
jgi:hypothetical protein